MATAFKPGDRVSVPWGFAHVAGTVLGFLGPPGKRFVRVQVVLDSDVDADESSRETVLLPEDLLERGDAA